MDELLKFAAFSLIGYFVPRTVERVGKKFYDDSQHFRDGYHKLIPIK